MNKKLGTYFGDLGFVVTGNDAHGKFKGYEVSVNVTMLDSVAPVKMHVSLYATNEVKALIVNEIKNFKFKYFIVAEDLYGISLGFNDPLTVGKLLNRMDDMLDKIFGVFAKYEAKGLGYCPVCGEELKEESKKYKIDYSLITMDNDCVKGLNAVIEQDNEEFKNAPNNYLKGTVGALLGAFVGAVIFVILFYFGFVSALTSLVAVLLGSFAYKKLGGKPNGVMIVIVTVISVATMLGTLTGIYVLIAEAVAPQYNFSSTGIQAFTDMMTVSEFSGEFVTNLFMTLVYTLLGAGFEAFRLSKSIKRQGTIK